MFYLEHQGLRIYVRYEGEQYEPSFMRDESVTWYELNRFINEYMYMNVYYPDVRIRGDYVLVDFKGESTDIFVPELTPQEHVEHAIEDYHNYYQIPSFHSGDFFDMYNFNRFHKVEFDYSLKNSNDAKYINIDQKHTLIVDNPVMVPLIVTATYLGEGGESYSVSFEITITIEPLNKTSIHEVLYGVINQRYYIKGVIIAYIAGDHFLLRDETGVISCRIFYEVDDTGKPLKVGDRVQLVGDRSFMDRSVTPEFFGIYTSRIVSSNNSVVDTPEPMNMNDFFNLDYTRPDNCGKYVSITGEVIFTGNDYYHSYAIRQDGFEYPLSFELVGQDNLAFITMIDEYYGDIIRVEGYIYDFYSVFHPFSWNIIYMNHTVILDQ